MTVAHRSGEQRSSERFGLALPITLEGEEGRTHDIGPGGLLVEMATQPPVGSHVTITLRYRAKGVPCSVSRIGTVVRVEALGDNFNVAVKLRKPLFD
ncbi:MAG TPA: PilZ domain-containing protein [Ramlibacter sp.]|nr:PilZ domain-containing protein [Ramlibacter sp.]